VHLPGVLLARHDAGALSWSVLVLPAWAVVAFLAVLPMAWTVRFRAAGGRQGLSVCARCGYDLRVTPGRCPECGAEPPPPHNAMTQ
jgi:hypothetical protein